MNSLGMGTTLSATSAAGAMLVRRARSPILVGVMLAGFGTSTASVLPADVLLRPQPTAAQTTAGTTIFVGAPSGAAIGELRRLSGLTWDQLGRLFKVSRRSLHFWASGKSMAASNEEHLQRILAVVRKLDQGTAKANRAMLLGVREDGSLPIDLLAVGHYERVLAMLGPGKGLRGRQPKLTREARIARAPHSPEELVDALQDPIHSLGGKSRVARSVRVRGDS